jgi:hypothetical protein
MLHDATLKNKKSVLIAWNKFGIEPEELTNKNFHNINN